MTEALKQKVLKLHAEGKSPGLIAKQLMGQMTYQEALNFVDQVLGEQAMAEAERIRQLGVSIFQERPDDADDAHDLFLAQQEQEY